MPNRVTRNQRAGRPPFLSDKQRTRLADYIEKIATSKQGGRLTGKDIHNYILSELGKTYHLDFISYILMHMLFSWITSRYKHPKQSIEAQEEFKKILNKNGR